MIGEFYVAHVGEAARMQEMIDVIEARGLDPQLAGDVGEAEGVVPPPRRIRWRSAIPRIRVRVSGRSLMVRLWDVSIGLLYGIVRYYILDRGHVGR